VYATTAEECRAACCGDANCEVFQFAEPVDSCCGVGCWRGVASTCNGPDVPPDADTTGRKLFVNEMMFSNAAGNTSTPTAAAESAPGQPWGDILALGMSSLVASCILGLCAAVVCLRWAPPWLRPSRRVVPVVHSRVSGDLIAADPSYVGVKPKERRKPRNNRRVMPVVAERASRRHGIVLSQGRILAQAQEAAAADAPADGPRRFGKAHAAAAALLTQRRSPQLLEYSAKEIQRGYRAHLVRRYMHEYRRHRAAVRMQVAARDFIGRRQQAAAKLQRGFAPRLATFATQRAEAKRLMNELNELLETTREQQAAAAFAGRYAADGVDFDDLADLDGDGLAESSLPPRGARTERTGTSVRDGTEDGEMEAYLGSLRRAAGLPQRSARYAMPPSPAGEPVQVKGDRQQR
jgi:hypothetical protein